MDPIANRNEQVNLARYIQRYIDKTDEIHVSLDKIEEDVMRLAELVIALHEWRIEGGFDPYQPNAPTAPNART